MLFGINNWGIKLGFENYSNSTTTIIKNPSTKLINSDSDYTISLDAGTKIDTGSKIFTPSFNVAFINTKSGYEKFIDPDGYVSENNYNGNHLNNLIIGGGTGIEFAKKGIVQNKLNINTDIDLTLYPKYDYSTETATGLNAEKQDKSNFELKVNPSYVATITPAKNITIKAEVGLPLTLSTSKTGKTTTIVAGTEHPGTDYTHKETDFSALLIGNVAVQYAVKPEVCNINLGCMLESPTFKAKSTYTKDGNADAEKSKESSISDGVTTTLSAGFSYYFAKTVLLDVNWNILNLDGVGTNTSFNAAWNTAFRIGLSAKF